MRALRAMVVFLLMAPGHRALAEPDGPSPPPGTLDRSGMSELVFWQGVNGLAAGTLLGTAVTAGTIDNECRTTIGAEMNRSEACTDAYGRAAGIAAVGLAAGIAVPLLLTRGHDVRTGDVLLVNRSTLLGLMHGYVIPFASGLDNGDVGDRRALAALTFTGDLVGVGVGSLLARRYDIAPGKVSFVGTLHSATFIAAMTVGNSLPDDVSESDERVISAVALGLADVALGVGLAYLDRIDIGRNRVFWLDTGAIVGWIGGAGLGAVFAGRDERAAAIGSTLGMAAGIALTYWATEGSEPWRRRHDGVVSFEPPMLRVEPVASEGAVRDTRVSVDAIRGSF